MDVDASDSIDDKLDDVEKTTISGMDDMICMPEVSDNAIEAQEAKDAQIEDDVAQHDSAGTAFDPEKHMVRDGKPHLTKTGRYRRLTKTSLATGSKSSVGHLADNKGKKVKTTAENLALGTVAATMTFSLGVLAGGIEWLPIKDNKTGVDETLMLQKAYGDYFAATGKTDFPPGVALTIALIGYAVPRFAKPKTQNRVKVISKWFKNLLFSEKKNDDGEDGKDGSK